MNFENRIPRLPQNENPKHSRQKKQNGHHAVEGGQGHLSCRQVVIVVLLRDFYSEIDGDLRIGLVVWAVVEIEVVEALLGDTRHYHYELELERF